MEERELIITCKSTCGCGYKTQGPGLRGASFVLKDIANHAEKTGHSCELTATIVVENQKSYRPAA